MRTLVVAIMLALLATACGGVIVSKSSSATSTYAPKTTIAPTSTLAELVTAAEAIRGARQGPVVQFGDSVSLGDGITITVGTLRVRHRGRVFLEANVRMENRGTRIGHTPYWYIVCNGEPPMIGDTDSPSMTANSVEGRPSWDDENGRSDGELWPGTYVEGERAFGPVWIDTVKRPANFPYMTGQEFLEEIVLNPPKYELQECEPPRHIGIQQRCARDCGGREVPKGTWFYYEIPKKVWEDYLWRVETFGR